MAYRRKHRGMSATDATGVTTSAYCQSWLSFLDPICWFANTPSNIAPPPAPTDTALTLPPASGEDAAALAQSLSDQQLQAQQTLNAGQVQSSWWDELTGNTAALDPFNPPGGGISWLVWLAGGVGVAALLLTGGGSPRRYGR